MHALGGVVSDHLLLGADVGPAHHDYRDAQETLEVVFSRAEAEERIGTLVSSLTAQMSSSENWPKIEAFACEAMKYPRLHGASFAHAYAVAGFGGRKPAHKQPDYLKRFSPTPAVLLARLDPRIVVTWRNRFG